MDAPLDRADDLPRAGARGASGTPRADLLPTVVRRAVEAAGGVPVLLPPLAPHARRGRAAGRRRHRRRWSSPAAPTSTPAAYGEQPHERTPAGASDRDAWELALLDAADEAGLPVLGVCRGMQLMAVHAGGTLDQHAPGPGRPRRPHPRRRRLRRASRWRREPGSRLAALVGAAADGALPPPPVRARATPASRPVAWADDGTLEAMEAAGDRFVRRRPVAPGDAGGGRADGRPGLEAARGARRHGPTLGAARAVRRNVAGSVSTRASAMPTNIPIELAATSRGSETRPGISCWTFSIIEVSTMPAASATNHSRVPTRSSRNTPSGTNRPMLARNSTRSTLSLLVSGSRSG